jgi:hypothetical protein
MTRVEAGCAELRPELPTVNLDVGVVARLIQSIDEQATAESANASVDHIFVPPRNPKGAVGGGGGEFTPRLIYVPPRQMLSPLCFLFSWKRPRLISAGGGG